MTEKKAIPMFLETTLEVFKEFAEGLTVWVHTSGDWVVLQALVNDATVQGVVSTQIQWGFTQARALKRFPSIDAQEVFAFSRTEDKDAFLASLGCDVDGQVIWGKVVVRDVPRSTAGGGDDTHWDPDWEVECRGFRDYVRQQMVADVATFFPAGHRVLWGQIDIV